MKKILIIEDEKLISKMYEKILSNHGFDVTLTSDGKVGLETALETHPDLILLDIRMPEMNGIEVFGKLRSDPWGKTAKVIILTNYDARNKVLNAGEKEDNTNLPEVKEFWSLIRNLPTAYLIKTDNRPEKVLEKVVEILGEKQEEKKHGKNPPG